jgi:hypothetical protein
MLLAPLSLEVKTGCLVVAESSSEVIIPARLKVRIELFICTKHIHCEHRNACLSFPDSTGSGSM